MKKYKPEYLGKVMPEDPPQLKKFMQDKYDKFSEVYDVCKEHSEDITDIRNISDSEDETLSVKLITNDETIEEITKNINEDEDSKVIIKGDTIIT